MDQWWCISQIYSQGSFVRLSILKADLGFGGAAGIYMQDTSWAGFKNKKKCQTKLVYQVIFFLKQTQFNLPAGFRNIYFCSYNDKALNLSPSFPNGVCKARSHLLRCLWA